MQEKDTIVMTTQNVPVTYNQSEADQACQQFGCGLPDLVSIGLRIVLAAGRQRSPDLAVLTPQANWAGQKTILEELNISQILGQVQGSNGNNSGPPTI
jgi:hypothetical protein